MSNEHLFKLTEEADEDGVRFSMAVTIDAKYQTTGLMLRASGDPEGVKERIGDGLRMRILDEMRRILEEEGEIPSREAIEAGMVSLAREWRGRL